MARRKTQQEFIHEAKIVHGDKYDYSLVSYVNNRIKVKLICQYHGEFFISPAGHTAMGYGCIKCGGTYKRTTDEFIKNARKLHHDRYNYSKVVYKNTSTDVIIGCPVHGDILQTPFEHMHSYGCSKCGTQQRNITKIRLGQLPSTVLDRTKYQDYIKEIRKVTNFNYRNYKDIINPLNLALSHTNGYHLDHIFSKRSGFEFNVLPAIIGHWTNLRILPSLENITKNLRCDKTLEQLYEDYYKETK